MSIKVLKTTPRGFIEGFDPGFDTQWVFLLKTGTGPIGPWQRLLHQMLVPTWEAELMVRELQ